MERIEYRGVVDKSNWPRGPWDNEPDKVQWPDEETGLPCLAVRGPHSSGHWCGYVGVPEGHPLHGVGYGDCPMNCGADWCDHTPESRFDVHGGLTFAATCSPNVAEDKGICHRPAPGESDHVWWFGFDCTHHNDFSPAFHGHHYQSGVYRDLAYVQDQCRTLAKQLARFLVISLRVKK